ncbi:hypothetical protein PLUA15_70041 [Pseudomonas lundensis]|uniref:Uncharacterized protein n=1 Tax=Pseudomonas lundensis TaxID=86185 RepID=A0AAX2HFS8_9PSED|nr:hypothetical protein PLUA15_70041 [Pseudomonas lundensis]
MSGCWRNERAAYAFKRVYESIEMCLVVNKSYNAHGFDLHHVRCHLAFMARRYKGRARAGRGCIGVFCSFKRCAPTHRRLY